MLATKPLQSEENTDAFVTKSSASETLVATLERVLQRKKAVRASSLSAGI